MLRNTQIKTAVVTGCAGFIGINLTQILLQKGWKIYGIDKLAYPANISKLTYLQKFYEKQFTFINDSIENINWLPECDIIFNLAAESDVDSSNICAKKFINSNIMGVENLLSLLNSRAVFKDEAPIFFHMSTDEVYGDIEWGSFNESAILNPSNPYAASKASADLLIQSFARTHNIKYFIARPTNNYGPFQYPEKLIPLTVKRILRGKTINLHNKGTPIRTWLHVEDTISAILTIIEKGELNNIYNISTYDEISNIELVKKIISIINIDLNPENHITHNYDRPGQDVRYSIDSTKIRDLGWHPKLTIDNSLIDIVGFYEVNWRW